MCIEHRPIVQITMSNDNVTNYGKISSDLVCRGDFVKKLFFILKIGQLN